MKKKSINADDGAASTFELLKRKKYWPFPEGQQDYGNIYDFSNSHDKVKQEITVPKEPLTQPFWYNKGPDEKGDKKLRSPFLYEHDYKERDPEPEPQYPQMDERYRKEKVPNRKSSMEKIANNIVAEYILQTNPIILNEGTTKVALTIGELEKQTSEFSKKHTPGCTAKLTKTNRKYDRYTFRVVCSKKESNSAGHTVKVQILRNGNVRKVRDLDIKVSCSCPFYRFYGPKYNADQRKYDEGSTHKDYGKIAPDTNDVNRVNLICKHVATVKPLLERYDLLTLKEKKKRYRS